MARSVGLNLHRFEYGGSAYKRSVMICGRENTEAHHIRFAEPRAMGKKVGDQWTVPLCALHHRDLHAAGNEQAWWQEGKQDPMAAAEGLWQKSRNVPTSPIASSRPLPEITRSNA